jgi:hypothetical protein
MGRVRKGGRRERRVLTRGQEEHQVQINKKLRHKQMLPMDPLTVEALQVRREGEEERRRGLRRKDGGTRTVGGGRVEERKVSGVHDFSRSFFRLQNLFGVLYLLFLGSRVPR